MYARSSTISDLEDLVSRITDCVTSGASAAGCTAKIQVDWKHCFENMGDLYDSYAQRLGLQPPQGLHRCLWRPQSSGPHPAGGEGPGHDRSSADAVPEHSEESQGAIRA
ncbi:peptidase M20 domain-containing protein 2 [Trichonephila inaurata madagascariensis]|uniref:Peptidase M20 domain-containing protein 2 n=1 Tax=Trichonephila inaurata madagascariensis TaxID=2747483 RepID=A0A8X6Y824_9ARAC|nr:peptidase M20 domain-containing protein 2 [Trichonephila inaurata madagascariensis]